MVFEYGFCFLLFASRFAAEWVFFVCLFLVVKDRAYPPHLRDDHQPARISSATHSRHSFIILAFSYTFTVLIFFSLSPRKRCGSFHSYKCGGQIPFSCVCSAPSLSSYD